MLFSSAAYTHSMFVWSGVQHTLLCFLFCLFSSNVLCTQCCQFLWILYSLAFINNEWLLYLGTEEYLWLQYVYFQFRVGRYIYMSNILKVWKMNIVQVLLAFEICMPMYILYCLISGTLYQDQITDWLVFLVNISRVHGFVMFRTVRYILRKTGSLKDKR
jgi:hypothetical protein